MGVRSSVIDIDDYYCIEAYLYKKPINGRSPRLKIEIVYKHIDGSSLIEENPSGLMETCSNVGFPTDKETVDNVICYLQDKTRTTYLSSTILREDHNLYIRLYTCRRDINHSILKKTLFF
jgi:hypothetical protein